MAINKEIFMKKNPFMLISAIVVCVFLSVSCGQSEASEQDTGKTVFGTSTPVESARGNDNDQGEDEGNGKKPPVVVPPKTDPGDNDQGENKGNNISYDEGEYVIFDIEKQFISSPANPGIRPFDCSFIDASDGWVAVGTEIGFTPRGFIAKFDKNGQKLWERYLINRIGDFCEFNSVMEITDGYLIRGRLITDDNCQHSIIIKYNKNGDLAWIKNLRLDDVVVNEAGAGFIGIGGKNNVYIAQFDTDGKELWKKYIGDSLTLSEKEGVTADTVYLSRIFLMPNNNGLLIRGTMARYYENSMFGMGSGYSTVTPFMTSVTLDGNVRWQKDIPMLPGYEREIVIDDGIIVLGVNGAKKYDFDWNLILEIPFETKENHYFHNNSGSAITTANKAGENYFITGYFSDGSASCFALGFNSDGKVIWNTPRHNAAGTGTGICYYGAVPAGNGIAVLAGYRYYGVPTTMGPHEITLHFLYYDLTTKTFTQSPSLL